MHHFWKVALNRSHAHQTQALPLLEGLLVFLQLCPPASQHYIASQNKRIGQGKFRSHAATFVVYLEYAQLHGCSTQTNAAEANHSLRMQGHTFANQLRFI